MKVQINKYLRNIGINEKNYWVIAEDHGNDSRYKEDEEGFICGIRMCTIYKNRWTS